MVRRKKLSDYRLQGLGIAKPQTLPSMTFGNPTNTHNSAETVAVQSTKEKLEQLQRQNATMEQQLKDIGVSEENIKEVDDNRNILQKAFNLKKNTGPIMGALELINRPAEALQGLMASSNLGENSLKAALDGLTGRKEYTLKDAMGIEFDNPLMNGLANLGFEMAVDPFNFVNIPWKNIGKTTKQILNKAGQKIEFWASKSQYTAEAFKTIKNLSAKVIDATKDTFGLWKNKVYKNFSENVSNSFGMTKQVSNEAAALNLELYKEVDKFGDDLIDGFKKSEVWTPDEIRNFTKEMDDITKYDGGYEKWWADLNSVDKVVNDKAVNTFKNGLSSYIGKAVEQEMRHGENVMDIMTKLADGEKVIEPGIRHGGNFWRDIKKTQTYEQLTYWLEQAAKKKGIPYADISEYIKIEKPLHAQKNLVGQTATDAFGNALKRSGAQGAEVRLTLAGQDLMKSFLKDLKLDHYKHLLKNPENVDVLLQLQTKGVASIEASNLKAIEQAREIQKAYKDILGKDFQIVDWTSNGQYHFMFAPDVESYNYVKGIDRQIKQIETKASEVANRLRPLDELELLMDKVKKAKAIETDKIFFKIQNNTAVQRLLQDPRIDEAFAKHFAKSYEEQIEIGNKISKHFQENYIPFQPTHPASFEAFTTAQNGFLELVEKKRKIHVNMEDIMDYGGFRIRYGANDTNLVGNKLFANVKFKFSELKDVDKFNVFAYLVEKGIIDLDTLPKEIRTFRDLITKDVDTILDLYHNPKMCISLSPEETNDFINLSEWALSGDLKWFNHEAQLDETIDAVLTNIIKGNVSSPATYERVSNFFMNNSIKSFLREEKHLLANPPLQKYFDTLDKMDDHIIDLQKKINQKIADIGDVEQLRVLRDTLDKGLYTPNVLTDVGKKLDDIRAFNNEAQANKILDEFIGETISKAEEAGAKLVDLENSYRDMLIRFEKRRDTTIVNELWDALNIDILSNDFLLTEFNFSFLKDNPTRMFVWRNNSGHVMFSKKAPLETASVEIGSDLVQDIVKRQNLRNQVIQNKQEMVNLTDTITEAQIAREINSHPDFTYSRSSLLELKRREIMSWNNEITNTVLSTKHPYDYNKMFQDKLSEQRNIVKDYNIKREEFIEAKRCLQDQVNTLDDTIKGIKENKDMIANINEAHIKFNKIIKENEMGISINNALIRNIQEKLNTKLTSKKVIKQYINHIKAEVKLGKSPKLAQQIDFFKFADEITNKLDNVYKISIDKVKCEVILNDGDMIISTAPTGRPNAVEFIFRDNKPTETILNKHSVEPMVNEFTPKFKPQSTKEFDDQISVLKKEINELKKQQPKDNTETRKEFKEFFKEKLGKNSSINFDTEAVVKNLDETLLGKDWDTSSEAYNNLKILQLQLEPVKKSGLIETNSTIKKSFDNLEKYLNKLNDAKNGRYNLGGDGLNDLVSDIGDAIDDIKWELNGVKGNDVSEVDFDYWNWVNETIDEIPTIQSIEHVGDDIIINNKVRLTRSGNVSDGYTTLKQGDKLTSTKIKEIEGSANPDLVNKQKDLKRLENEREVIVEDNIAKQKEFEAEQEKLKKELETQAKIQPTNKEAVALQKEIQDLKDLYFKEVPTEREKIKQKIKAHLDRPESNVDFDRISERLNYLSEEADMSTYKNVLDNIDDTLYEIEPINNAEFLQNHKNTEKLIKELEQAKQEVLEAQKAGIDLEDLEDLITDITNIMGSLEYKLNDMSALELGRVGAEYWEWVNSIVDEIPSISKVEFSNKSKSIYINDDIRLSDHLRPAQEQGRAWYDPNENKFNIMYGHKFDVKKLNEWTNSKVNDLIEELNNVVDNFKSTTKELPQVRDRITFLSDYSDYMNDLDDYVEGTLRERPVPPMSDIEYEVIKVFVNNHPELGLKVNTIHDALKFKRNQLLTNRKTLEEFNEMVGIAIPKPEKAKEVFDINAYSSQDLTRQLKEGNNIYKGKIAQYEAQNALYKDFINSIEELKVNASNLLNAGDNIVADLNDVKLKIKELDKKLKLKNLEVNKAGKQVKKQHALQGNELLEKHNLYGKHKADYDRLMKEKELLQARQTELETQIKLSQEGGLEKQLELEKEKIAKRINSIDDGYAKLTDEFNDANDLLSRFEDQNINKIPDTELSNIVDDVSKNVDNPNYIPTDPLSQADLVYKNNDYVKPMLADLTKLHDLTTNVLLDKHKTGTQWMKRWLAGNGGKEMYVNTLNRLVGIQMSIHGKIANLYRDIFKIDMGSWDIAGYVKHMLSPEQASIAAINKTLDGAKTSLGGEIFGRNLKKLGAHREYQGSIVDINKYFDTTLFNPNPIEATAIALELLPSSFSLSGVFKNMFDTGAIKKVNALGDNLGIEAIARIKDDTLKELQKFGIKFAADGSTTSATKLSHYQMRTIENLKDVYAKTSEWIELYNLQTSKFGKFNDFQKRIDELDDFILKQTQELKNLDKNELIAKNFVTDVVLPNDANTPLGKDGLRKTIEKAKAEKEELLAKLSKKESGMAKKEIEKINKRLSELQEYINKTCTKNYLTEDELLKAKADLGPEYTWLTQDMVNKMKSEFEVVSRAGGIDEVTGVEKLKDTEWYQQFEELLEEMKDPNGRRYAIHKGVFSQIKRFSTKSTSAAKEVFGAVQKYITTPWKKLSLFSVGFHTRNLTTNYVNASLAGFKLTDFNKAMFEARKDRKVVDEIISALNEELLTGQFRTGDEQLALIKGILDNNLDEMFIKERASYIPNPNRTWDKKHSKEWARVWRDYTEMLSKGVIGNNQFNAEAINLLNRIKANAKGDLQGNVKLGGIIGKSQTSAQKLFETSLRLSKDMDDYAKIAMYRLLKEQEIIDATGEVIKQPSKYAKLLEEAGIDATRPEMYVKQVLFDYNNLTYAEESYMKALFPFYTWARKNLEFQIKNLFRNTPKYMRWYNGLQGWKNGIVGDDENENDTYANYIPIWKDDGGITYIKMEMSWNAADDILRGEGIINALTPIIKTPLEMITGYDFFTKRNWDTNGNFLGFGLGMNNIVETAQIMSKMIFNNYAPTYDDKKRAGIIGNQLYKAISWTSNLFNISDVIKEDGPFQVIANALPSVFTRKNIEEAQYYNARERQEELRKAQEHYIKQGNKVKPSLYDRLVGSLK